MLRLIRLSAGDEKQAGVVVGRGELGGLIRTAALASFLLLRRAPGLGFRLLWHPSVAMAKPHTHSHSAGAPLILCPARKKEERKKKKTTGCWGTRIPAIVATRRKKKKKNSPLNDSTSRG